MTGKPPPATQTITREGETGDPTIIRIETLTENHFDAARRIENEFIGIGKGFCFGLFPYRMCPMGSQEFEGVYRKSSDRCSTYGVAILSSGNVVGICKLRDTTQPAAFMENALHTPKPGELYLDTIAVTKEARGKGVGTQLMQWAEDVAAGRHLSKLSLGVVKGNPAIRLYERKGYVQVSSNCFVPSFFLGRPNGIFGAVMMEKDLSE